MPDSKPRGLMKRSTVCEFLDMGRKKVDRLRLGGEIEGWLVDGAWYFTKASVDAFADRRCDVNTVALIAEGV